MFNSINLTISELKSILEPSLLLFASYCYSLDVDCELLLKSSSPPLLAGLLGPILEPKLDKLVVEFDWF